MKSLTIPMTVLALALAACGSDIEVDAYTPGIAKRSKDGAYDVALWSIPGPPRKGTNTFELAISHAATGEPVTGASVEVVPSMPDHGHGSDGVAIVTEQMPGKYRADNVVLQMFGVWQFDISTEAEGASDVTHFWFDVQ